MIIINDNIAGIWNFQTSLSQNFEMKDLKHLNYFLCLKVTLSKDSYYLTQVKYASDLLFKARLTNSKILYRQLVDNLIYLLSPGLTFHMLFIWSVNSWARLNVPILLLFFKFYTISRAFYFMVCTSHLVFLWFHGVVINSSLLPVLVLRLSIVLLLTRHLNFCSCVDF